MFFTSRPRCGLSHSIYLVFFLYSLLYTGKTFDFLLAPFTTLFTVDNCVLNILKVLFVLDVLYLFPAWLFLQSMNHIIALLFYKEFRMLNTRFLQAIEADGRFNGNVKAFRHRHQVLSLNVKLADNLLMTSNVGCFCVHAFNVIVIFYSLMFFTLSDRVALASQCFILFGNIAGLISTTADGILVNHAVSENVKLFYCNDEDVVSIML